MSGGDSIRADFRDKTATIISKVDGHTRALVDHKKQQQKAATASASAVAAAARGMQDGMVKLSSDMAAMTISFDQSVDRLAETMGNRLSVANTAVSVQLSEAAALTAATEARTDTRMKAIDALVLSHKKMSASLLGTLSAINTHVGNIS
jgi:hypothetical protein